MQLTQRRKRICLLCLAAVTFSCSAGPARATELKPATVKGFDQYIRVKEAQMDADLRDGHFLAIDRLPPDERSQAYADLRVGKFYVRPVRVSQDGEALRAPGGIIHDWVGI